MSDPAVLNTILKPIYGAKEEAVSGLCLHCVHCNKLASIDHLATNSLLTGHLSAWRHRKETGTQVPRVNYIVKAIRTSSFSSVTMWTPAVRSFLPSTNRIQKSNGSLRLSLSDRSVVYYPIKSTPALFLLSDLTLNICFHLPHGYDLLLSPNEQVSAT